MKAKTLLLMMVGGGIGITLLFLPYSPYLFVTNYGFPFAWLVKTFDHLMSNQYFWQVNMLNLVADITVWVVIIAIALFVRNR